MIFIVISFSNKHGFRTCCYNCFIKMIQEGETPKLCETIIGHKCIHLPGDVDNNDQRRTLEGHVLGVRKYNTKKQMYKVSLHVVITNIMKTIDEHTSYMLAYG